MFTALMAIALDCIEVPRFRWSGFTVCWSRGKKLKTERDNILHSHFHIFGVLTLTGPFSEKKTNKKVGISMPPNIVYLTSSAGSHQIIFLLIPQAYFILFLWDSFPASSTALMIVPQVVVVCGLSMYWCFTMFQNAYWL